jgi:hypothetical protein
MPLCREAVLGPAFTPGSLIRPSGALTIGPPSRRLWRRDGGPIGGVTSDRHIRRILSVLSEPRLTWLAKSVSYLLLPM